MIGVDSLLVLLAFAVLVIASAVVLELVERRGPVTVTIRRGHGKAENEEYGKLVIP
jgi:hypothetical protein